MDDTFIVESYLTSEEAHELTILLANKGIKSILQTMPDDNTSPYYHLFININDSDKAKPIINHFKNKLEQEITKSKQSCPKCKSVFPLVIEHKTSFFKRIFAFGTTPMKCLKCGTEWYI